MADYDRDIKTLHRDMAHVLDDADQFLNDLKGQRKVKGLIKKDGRHLKVLPALEL